MREPECDAGGHLSLHYVISAPQKGRKIHFEENVRLPGPAVEGLDQDLFLRLLRLLALAGATSYYKTYIPATVVVDWALTSSERVFFKNLILKGLAEFAYQNDVPQALRPAIVAKQAGESNRLPIRAASAPSSRRVLVAVGGGKDSIVSIETTRRMGVNMTLFSVNEYNPIRSTAEHAGIELLVASRHLDQGLFRLNNEGALNGHVPVTAINSIIGCLTAVRSGFDGVIFSNEASSSIGNVTWAGVDVNHQWSKSIDFEKSLRQLVNGPGLNYFSLLRPLTELEIMRRFAKLESYHSIFTSCNRAFHLDPSRRQLWCGDCPKCRFVFLCLAPFVPKQRVLSVFGGRDLFSDPAQHEGFLELLNVGDRLKPFECVGEVNECRAAIGLLLDSFEWAAHPFLNDPVVFRTRLPRSETEKLWGIQGEHFLPEAYEEALREV